MRIEKLESFKGGWIIGDFAPTLLSTSSFEVCVKRFKAGEVEPSHFQKQASEFTVVVSGVCRMGDTFLYEGDIIILEPGEQSDFEALEDSVIVGVKTPSIPNDKVNVGG